VKLLILMGLTGVGKSTAVRALQESGTAFTLLPNRRALTDTHIIPEMQRVDKKPVEPVSDRLERFALTRRYRELYPGGMVHALKRYLEANPPAEDVCLVFDNLRGLDEARAAAAAFPEARFILLDAPPLVRLGRLVARRDTFDKVALEPGGDVQAGLQDLEGLKAVFDPDDVVRLAARGVPADVVRRGVRIILSEAQNYDMDAALAYLRAVKEARDFLHVATDALSVDEVRAQIGAWL
jgi:hypothetical protein